MGTLTLSFAAFNVLLLFGCFFVFSCDVVRENTKRQQLNHLKMYQCIGAYMVLLIPYLEHVQSSAILPVITSDLLQQLVLAIYLNHIQDIWFPC